MKEIIELNGALLAELGNCFLEDGFYVGRSVDPEEFRQLPARWQAKINALRGKINEVVPDDFSYTLWLGRKVPDFSFEYEDGAQTEFFQGHDWNVNESIVEQLGAIDWGAERTKAIGACQAFQVLLAGAKDKPARLPSTRQLQKRFGNEMKTFVKKHRNDDGRVHVLMFREEDGLNADCGIQEETFANLKMIPGELVDLMTVRYWVITIVSEGKPLAVGKIDHFKELALKELREYMPISYAKALGKL
jgi:hypothetical protein